jgi:hypothetical protein
MKDASLKGDQVMKLFSTIAFLAIASSAIAGRALSLDTAVKTTVPFNFTAGDQQFPAGTYTISRESFGLLRIQNREKGIEVYVAAMPASNEVNNDGELIFKRYGNQYFLKEVLASRLGFDSKIAAWKLEKKAQHEGVTPASDSEKVAVAPGSY